MQNTTNGGGQWDVNGVSRELNGKQLAADFHFFPFLSHTQKEPISPRSPNGFYYPPASQQQHQQLPPQPAQSHQHYHHQSMTNGGGNSSSSHYSHHQFGNQQQQQQQANYGPPPPHMQSPMAFGNGYNNGNHHQPHYGSGNYSHRNHGFGKHTHTLTLTFITHSPRGCSLRRQKAQHNPINNRITLSELTFPALGSA